MAHINRKTHAVTLTLAESVIWAGPQTPDGRDLDEVRRRVRAEVQAAANETQHTYEIYACKRHGGCIVDIVYPED